MENVALANRTSPLIVSNAAESSKSAVSWAAILSGAVVAAATSLLLLVLATGLGLTAVSPWPDNGPSAGTLAVMTAIAFIVIQWISASVGGYITGRHIEMLPNERLVQAWRAGSWKSGEFSIAAFNLTAEGGKTKLKFEHRGFPNGNGTSLANGWHSHYWEPLAKFLAQS